MTRLQRLYADADTPDVQVVEPRELTKSYDAPLRPPATPIYHRWPILAGFLCGARVDLIADGLARGERWEVGPAPFAPLDTGIWLLELHVSYAEQIAAWRVRDPGVVHIAPEPSTDFEVSM